MPIKRNTTYRIGDYVRLRSNFRTDFVCEGKYEFGTVIAVTPGIITVKWDGCGTEQRVKRNQIVAAPSRKDDELILDILYMREVMTSKQVSAKLKERGIEVTRNRIVGIETRIREAVRDTPDLCKKTENRTGGMEERWWDAVL